jgi:hypothetical protein
MGAKQLVLYAAGCAGKPRPLLQPGEVMLIAVQLSHCCKILDTVVPAIVCLQLNAAVLQSWLIVATPPMLLQDPVEALVFGSPWERLSTVVMRSMTSIMTHAGEGGGEGLSGC